MSIVQLRMIKNIGVLLLSLCMAMVVVSCVEDEEIQTSPDCYIASFTVADIVSDVTVTSEDGSEKVETRTISGGEVYFNISQTARTINIVDSLPDWTDLTRIVPTVSSTGYVYIKREGDADFLPFANGSEEVDFTKPVQFLVAATDGVSTSTYTAKIVKHKSGEADSLMWTKVNMLLSEALQLDGRHRTVMASDTIWKNANEIEKIVDSIYVFAENGGAPTVTAASLSEGGRSWLSPEPLHGGIDWQSVTVFKNKLYALGADGKIYKGTNHGTTWAVAADETVERLLGVDSTYIYAYDGVKIVGSRDLNTWTPCGGSDMDMLPKTDISSVWYTSRTNEALSTVVMTGLTDNNAKNAVVWYKVSSADDELNQEWSYMQVDESNSFGCPKLKNMSMVRYDNVLTAIGGKYEGLYISKDNGLSWKLSVYKKNLPKAVRNIEDKEMSLAVGGGYLWLVRSGGEVWKGKK